LPGGILFYKVVDAGDQVLEGGFCMDDAWLFIDVLTKVKKFITD
jgi:hypothetical protein